MALGADPATFPFRGWGDPDAATIDRRDGQVIVAARREGAGRVVTVGEIESWRWRMARWIDLAGGLTIKNGADSATVWLLRGDDYVEVAYGSGAIAPAQGTLMPVPLDLYERMRLRRQPIVFDATSGESVLERVVRIEGE